MINIRNHTQQILTPVLPDRELSNARILIIDDCENNIKVLGSLLRNHDCEVLTAMNAKAGLTIAEVKLPDLILLDVLMPDIDGFETYRLLKNNNLTKDIPVIYLSASTHTKNILQGLELGAVDYIIKPFNHSELIARVKNQLKTRLANDHVRALFNSKSHCFVTFNKNFEITYFNSTATERSFLFAVDALKIGESIFNFIPSQEHAFVKKRIENVLKGRILEFEKSFIALGKTRWFNYILEPVRNSSYEITGCMMSGTDITTKKESELEDADYFTKINEVFDETQQSMRYAGYIQRAIFPHNIEDSGLFEDCFILFKPKEKVSGDFYWTHELGDKTLFILGDCTGHGVPGALLTTISIVLLERIVKYEGIMSPEKILTELNTNIVNLFNQKDGGIKDGLEMAVCLLNKKNQTLEFAGAKRDLLISGDGEVIEIKGNRQDIGGTEMKTFTKEHLDLKKGHALYVSSDGYTDQIGGEKNKKYMKKRLKKLIQSFNQRSMKEQKLIFDRSITNWRGNEEQTDDILLIGIRI